jgi:hypothetical protein
LSLYALCLFEPSLNLCAYTQCKANGVEGKVSVKIKESRPFSLL